MEVFSSRSLALFKNKKRLTIILTLAILLDVSIFYYLPVMASNSEEIADFSENMANIVNAEDDNTFDIGQNNEEKPELTVKWTSERLITAYNSEAAQTDATPCITANGFNVCKHGVEDTIAANFLKFGTKVRIPELFGDRVFVVRDRMNKRHSDRIDVWMISKADAKMFGVQYAQIEVLD